METGEDTSTSIEGRKKTIDNLAKQGRIEFEPTQTLSPTGNSESSSDSIDRWGDEEDENESEPPRTPRRSIRVNENSPVDLTMASTNKEDDSTVTDGKKITQSDEEFSGSSDDSIERKDNVFLDESESSQDKGTDRAMSKSVTNDMVDDAKREISSFLSPRDATGGDTPGMDV